MNAWLLKQEETLLLLHDGKTLVLGKAFEALLIYVLLVI